MMLSFKKWLTERPIICPDNEKEFLDDIVADENFPLSVQLSVMVNYLETECHCDDEQIDIFKDYYNEYIMHISRAHD